MVADDTSSDTHLSYLPVGIQNEDIVDQRMKRLCVMTIGLWEAQEMILDNIPVTLESWFERMKSNNEDVFRELNIEHLLLPIWDSQIMKLLVESFPFS